MVTTYNTSVATNGVVYPTGCSVHSVNVTGAGAGGTMVTIYDNPSTASGRIIWESPALDTGSYALGNFVGGGTVAQNGVYLAFTGTYTTPPTINIVYEP